MNPKLTDDHVAGLPLHLGRADLLEEIMSTPVLDERPVRDERPRRRTTAWLVPAAAAVVVAALAVGSAWWATGGPGAGPSSDRSGGVASQPTVGETGDYVVLDAPGWIVTAAYSDEKYGGEMTYEKGAQSFEMMWGPADSYDGYVEDRRHIVQPAADGDPIQILDKGAQMWAYSQDDHTAIREVQDGTWFEFRGEGMGLTGYRALLDSLQLVDEAAFDAALPDSFVTSAEQSTAVAKILDGIAGVADPLLPPGYERTDITSDQNDPYQMGAEVAGAVACAWIGEWEGATSAGDDGRAQRAADVLATSHDWPVLQQMNDSGDYPEVVWEYAADVAAGHEPQGYTGGLGCHAG